jgi:hypothetical protein
MPHRLPPEGRLVLPPLLDLLPPQRLVLPAASPLQQAPPPLRPLPLVPPPARPS